jgi:hypothetical protein
LIAPKPKGKIKLFSLSTKTSEHFGTATMHSGYMDMRKLFFQLYIRSITLHRFESLGLVQEQ